MSDRMSFTLDYIDYEATAVTPSDLTSTQPGAVRSEMVETSPHALARIG